MRAEPRPLSAPPHDLLSGHSSGVGAGAAFHVIAGLAIVLGVVYGVYWLLRSAARGRRGAARGELEVVAHAQLAQGRAVHLVRVADELVLLATSEHAVAPVRVYDGEAARRIAEALQTPPGAAPRRNLLDELRRRTAR